MPPIWRRFVVILVAGFFALLAGALRRHRRYRSLRHRLLFLALGPGVVDDNDVTSIAGRGRDARFDAAIFGNSHALLLDPTRLSPATGLRFVQLTTLGSGPREQIALMRYFLRRHADVKALVIAADWDVVHARPHHREHARAVHVSLPLLAVRRKPAALPRQHAERARVRADAPPPPVRHGEARPDRSGRHCGIPGQLGLRACSDPGARAAAATERLGAAGLDRVSSGRPVGSAARDVERADRRRRRVDAAALLSTPRFPVPRRARRRNLPLARTGWRASLADGVAAPSSTSWSILRSAAIARISSTCITCARTSPAPWRRASRTRSMVPAEEPTTVSRSRPGPARHCSAARIRP